YDLLQRASRDSASRAYALVSQFLGMVRQTLTLTSISAVLFSWNWILGLLVFLAASPSVIAWIIHGRKGYKVDRERVARFRYLTYLQSLMTTARSAKEIKLFGLREYFLTQYRSRQSAMHQEDSALAKQEALGLVPFLALANAVSVGAQIYALVVALRIGSVG